ncbi:cytochrome P450 [Nocardia sp. CA-151230]|uniref:cytochrome P450 n=1 Tax=Nocardia sp. CA-151230 TaxID=3239982 RepID=UPI003D8EAD0B
MPDSSTVPRSELDIFTDEFMADPYPAFRDLRDVGGVVHLDALDLWAVPRYAEARHILASWEQFCSADVALNEQCNAYVGDGILRADPPLHDQLRNVLASRLAPRALRKLEADINARARALVEPLVSRGSFEAISELVRRFPLEIVADLIGLPLAGREELLGLLDANFNFFGPDNARLRESAPKLGELMEYMMSTATRQSLAEGSMGRAVYEAADAGQIPEESAPTLVLTYVTAGIDTTVHALGHAIWLLAEHPEQWDLLRQDRSLIPQAFREVLRFESPMQVFGRTVRTDWVVDGVTVPAGDRLAVLFGAANRDERNWKDPDRFDIRRDNVEHLAFGYGLHVCAGQALARMEGAAILTALLDSVSRLEAGEPARHFNNVLRGLESLPVQVVASA